MTGRGDESYDAMVDLHSVLAARVPAVDPARDLGLEGDNLSEGQWLTIPEVGQIIGRALRVTTDVSIWRKLSFLELLGLIRWVRRVGVEILPADPEPSAAA